ncbi:MAG TPA: serine/threonine protein phosphatase [Cyanobacteria bacterium UBA12227]|nr:serine/threonine protein phosphatase [Cyanobacteria bacterium UBA12227]HAX90063.1 serine/threonine protein phosphatase [Cyanobacteria bacterium UBA11370]HBY78673.1 serine/threonine protein phosphatase [Cyanobacteria bacterium UBA11148]
MISPLKSIGAKLFLFVLAGSLVGLGGLSCWFYQLLKNQAKIEIQKTLNQKVGAIELELAKTEAFTFSMSAAVKTMYDLKIADPEAYKKLVFEFFLKRPNLAMAVYFGQTSFGVIKNREWFFPYFYPDPGIAGAIGKPLPSPYNTIRYSDLFVDDNYPEQDYYKIPVNAWKKVWLEPFDWHGITMTSLLEPFYDNSGKMIGIVGADVNVTALSDQVKGSVTSGAGYFIILSEQGKLLAYPPDPKKAQERQSYQDVPTLKLLWQKMPKNEAGIIQLEGNFWAYQRVPNTNWLMIAAVPRAVVLTPVLVSAVGGALAAGVVLALVIVLFVRQLNQRLQPILDECYKLAETNSHRTEDRGEFSDKNLGKISFDNTNNKLQEALVFNGARDELGVLSAAFNRMAEQLKESFETLEDKVKERTAELAGANQEIAALNERLKNENLRMSTELDILRQMQQLILPKAAELEAIEELDIAGFMEPADEVGGDYYDVLHTDGIVTIGIGDVTGHGLESGILMVMTQTAVRTLKEIREQDTLRFLDILNRTIYKNVQRMNSDKNLTLAILNYASGSLSISGQHEETLVVRKGGHIERIDTMDLGFPIGLDEDIADFISHTIVQLEPGDGVVLYTDGIPEAKDINKKFYGLERLCEVVSRNWHNSAEQIKQATIDDLREFIGEQKVFDDITLVVLKKKDQVMVKQEERSLLEAQLYS